MTLKPFACAMVLSSFAFSTLAQETETKPPPKYVQLAFHGQRTVNDRCPVQRKPLNRKMAPVWINGHPVGFC